MPEISRFLGIIILMYVDDHNPPHFHIRSGDYRATYYLGKGVVEGSLPVKMIKRVDKWATLHYDELMENWNRLKNGLDANGIKPLK